MDKETQGRIRTGIETSPDRSMLDVMKKTIFIAIFVSLIMFPTTPVVKAQNFTSEQQTTLNTLNQSLIALLTQLIAQLQAQIAEILAQQATQATQLGVVQSQVNTVVAQTAPVPVVVPPSLPPPPPPTPLTFSANSPLEDFCMVVGQGRGSLNNEYDFTIGSISVTGLLASGVGVQDEGTLTARWDTAKSGQYDPTQPHIYISADYFLGTIAHHEPVRVDKGTLRGTNLYARAVDVKEPGVFTVTIQSWIANNGRQVSGLPITLTRTAKWCQ